MARIKSTSPSSGKVSLEIQKAAFDVAEVHVEDFLAAAEITDHVEDLAAGLLQHFAHRALAEVQAVIRAGMHGDEALEAVHTAQHAIHAAKSLNTRHGRIVRMAGDANFGFLGHRHHAIKKILDALPKHIGIERAGLGERRLLLG